ncbi:hypothetical protein ACFL96_16285 [Thermoproteota archaeon]
MLKKRCSVVAKEKLVTPVSFYTRVKDLFDIPESGFSLNTYLAMLRFFYKVVSASMNPSGKGKGKAKRGRFDLQAVKVFVDFLVKGPEIVKGNIGKESDLSRSEGQGIGVVTNSVDIPGRSVSSTDMPRQTPETAGDSMPFGQLIEVGDGDESEESSLSGSAILAPNQTSGETGSKEVRCSELTTAAILIREDIVQRLYAYCERKGKRRINLNTIDSWLKRHSDIKSLPSELPVYSFIAMINLVKALQLRKICCPNEEQKLNLLDQEEEFGFIPKRTMTSISELGTKIYITDNGDYIASSNTELEIYKFALNMQSIFTHEKIISFLELFWVLWVSCEKDKIVLERLSVIMAAIVFDNLDINQNVYTDPFSDSPESKLFAYLVQEFPIIKDKKGLYERTQSLESASRQSIDFCVTREQASAMQDILKLFLIRRGIVYSNGQLVDEIVAAHNQGELSDEIKERLVKDALRLVVSQEEQKQGDEVLKLVESINSSKAESGREREITSAEKNILVVWAVAYLEKQKHSICQAYGLTNPIFEIGDLSFWFLYFLKDLSRNRSALMPMVSDHFLSHWSLEDITFLYQNLQGYIKSIP